MIGPRVLASTRQPVAARTVKCWDRLRQLIDPGQSGGVLYLHRGRNTLGAERLIVVATDYRSTYMVRFVCWALRPATAAEGTAFHSHSPLLYVPFCASYKT